MPAVVFASVLALLSAVPAAAGFICDGVDFFVLEQSAERTVLRWTWPPDLGAGEPLPEPDQVLLALPDATEPTVRAVELTTRPVALAPDGAARPADRVWEIGPARRFRDQWLRAVRIRPLLGSGERVTERLATLTLEIRHPSAAGAAGRSGSGFGTQSDPRTADLLAGVVVNPAAARGFREAAALAKRAPGAVADLFARSDRWVRVEIEETGIHRLDYAQLSAVLGADVDLVDPASLRLFGAPDVMQTRDAEDLSGSWSPDYEPVERALYVQSAGSTFAPGDRVWFHAVGVRTWADLVDPSAPLRAHVEHAYDHEVSYWLTWDAIGESPGDFAGPPLRMAAIDAAPTGTADRVRTTARARAHFEQDLAIYTGLVRDNWVWRDQISRGQFTSFSFELPAVVPAASTDSLAWFFTEPFMIPAPDTLSGRTIEHRARYELNGTTFTTFNWNAGQQSSTATAPVEFWRGAQNVLPGTNTLRIWNVSPDVGNGRSPLLFVDFFSFTWVRHLRADAQGLNWYVGEDEVPVPERRLFRLSDQGQRLSSALVLDLRDPRRPRRLLGQVGAGGAELELEIDLSAATRRSFELVFDDTALRPRALTRSRPRLLRREVAGPDGAPAAGWDMVVLYAQEFRPAAEDMVALRETDLPDRVAPRVTAVDVQDVYDQFGNGSKDPGAIRNYLKFLYEVDPRFEFALLIGDADRDSRGILRQGEDRDPLPTYVHTQWPFLPEPNSFTVPYARDDWFVSFQNPIQQEIFPNRYVDLPDAAIGRLPANSLAEANRMVQRIRRYEREPARGPWRNSILLVADDEVSLANNNYRERDHIDEAECVAEFLLPPALDVDKLYLTEFPSAPGSIAKPSSRQAMRAHWSEGRVVVHYIGHGSPEQMADENVFRIEDVPTLTNGSFLPLFLAFSCDVAVFDDAAKPSMSEQLVLQESGGAVATIAATQVTYIGPNEDLTETFYQALFPQTVLNRSAPLGRALLQGKLNADQAETSAFVQHNDAKYVLLGDPAMRLQTPSTGVQLTGTLTDGIQSGREESIAGRLEGVPSIAGTWYVEAKESADSTIYVMDKEPPGFADRPPTPLPYVLDGGSFYRGQGAFEDGSFATALRTPAFMRFGQNGRVRVLMESGDDLWVGLLEGLPVERTAPDSDDTEGPSIGLAFQNEARRVQPGAVLEATLEDASGINVLGSTPASSILLEFDDSGVSVDVTELFQLDEGVYTKGRLQVSLPDDIQPGPHRLALSAGDMLSNVARQELDFEVVRAGGIDIGQHAPLPNPFRNGTQFVVELEAPPGLTSEVEIGVFALDGSRVRTLYGRLDDGGGRLSVPWDGRDGRGDEIANGTYIYALRVRFPTDPPVTEVVTGKVVRMR